MVKPWFANWSLVAFRLAFELDYYLQTYYKYVFHSTLFFRKPLQAPSFLYPSLSFWKTLWLSGQNIHSISKSISHIQIFESRNLSSTKLSESCRSSNHSVWTFPGTVLKFNTSKAKVHELIAKPGYPN